MGRQVRRNRSHGLHAAVERDLHRILGDRFFQSLDCLDDGGVAPLEAGAVGMRPVHAVVDELSGQRPIEDARRVGPPLDGHREDLARHGLRQQPTQQRCPRA